MPYSFSYRIRDSHSTNYKLLGGLSVVTLARLFQYLLWYHPVSTIIANMTLRLAAISERKSLMTFSSFVCVSGDISKV